MISQLLWFSLFLLLLGSAFAVLHRRSNRTFPWLSDLAVHFTPQYAIGGIVLSALAFWQQEGLTGWTALTLAAYHSWYVLRLRNFTTVETSESANEANPVLSVATANLWTKERTLRALSKLEPVRSADVIALSEVPHLSAKTISDLFPDHPHITYVDRIHGHRFLSSRMALICRLAPTEIECIHEQSYGSRVILSARFEASEKAFKLVAMHPSSPSSPKRCIQRNAILAGAADVISTSEPTIVLGDMNTTPWSQAYQLLRGVRLGDPRRESTWLSRWPLLGLPIDHILLSGKIKVRHYSVSRSFGSDHRALYAEIELV